MGLDSHLPGSLDSTPQNFDVEQLIADQQFTDSRTATAVVHTDGSNIWADGTDSELASGSLGTPSDVRTAIQAAIDHAETDGGIALIKPGNYTMDAGGTDPDGISYCLEQKADVTLEISAGATLDVASGTTPAHAIFADGVDDWTITGGGTVDGGSHDASQTDTTDAMGIAVGMKTDIGTSPDTSTGCDNWLIEDITLTGGHRHGIESAGGSTFGLIQGLHLDDAGADDFISIGGKNDYITVRDCVATNRVRNIFESAAFEADDGPRHVWFVNCYSEINDIGFNVGKTHSNANRTSRHHHVINCIAADANTGFSVDPIGGFEIENVEFRGCTADNCGVSYRVSTKDNDSETIKDIFIDNCEGRGADSKTIDVNGDNTIDNLVIRNSTFTDPDGSNCQHLQTSPGSGDLRITVRNNTFRGATNNALRFGGSGSDYSRSTVEDNTLRSNSGTPIFFSASSIRQRVITRFNGTFADSTSTVPNSNAVAPGDYYIDDGTNTVTGEQGPRIWIGGSWRDMGIEIRTRSSDPGTGDLDDGQGLVYVSDGSSGVTGDDGDMIAAVNDGGTVKTTTLMDFSSA